MQIGELTYLKRALDLMGVDGGADAHSEVVIPEEWELRARLAEEELKALSLMDFETLAQGEDAAQRQIAKAAPNADAILTAAFDGGPLADLFFHPWRNIFDARDAERRVVIEGGLQRER